MTSRERKLSQAITDSERSISLGKDRGIFQDAWKTGQKNSLNLAENALILPKQA